MVSATRSKVEVVLADANPLVLSAMSECFDRDPRFSLIATASTAESFVAAVMRVPAKVAVIDWNLPSIGGAKLIEILREQETPPRVVVYGDDHADHPRRAMAAGAAAFAPRSGSVEALLDTCADVAAGKMVFPFVDIRELRKNPIETLSKKERAILEALSTGLTNRQLSADLGISTNTVKFHLSNLYDKLGVKNRAQAIAFYYSSRSDGLG
jgi:two-component system, NarL family, nitrate/nitrite response regulator NarP